MAQVAIFDTVPKNDLFNFFGKDNAVNGRRVVESLKFKKEDVATAANVPMTSVRYDGKMPADLEQRLIEWATALNLVGNYFQDINKTLLWFQVPNPHLGDYSPRDMIRLGRYNKLMRFIQTALDENTR